MNPAMMAASAGLGAVQTAANSISQHANNQAQMKWNEEMMHYQNWYNSPNQQVKRMQQAGLNPALMYGRGSEGGGTSASPQAFNPKAPQFSLAHDANESLALATNIQAMENQKRLADADVALKNAQTTKALADSKLTDTREGRAYFDMMLFKTLWAYDDTSQTFDPKAITNKRWEMFMLPKKKYDVSKYQAITGRKQWQTTDKNVNSLINLRSKEARLKQMDLNFYESLGLGAAPMKFLNDLFGHGSTALGRVLQGLLFKKKR